MLAQATPAARALLRDSRWDVQGAGPVAHLERASRSAPSACLVWLRLRRTVR